MTLIVRPGFQFDTDASTYIEAVEVADAQALETATRYAINDFVIGCKQDGIWSAIKASCILAGSRTLTGALTPLAGTAPTNFNFVSGDYNRKTGLVGDGGTKYLDSNRACSSDAQNDVHASIWYGTRENSTFRYLGGLQGGTTVEILGSSTGYAFRLNSTTIQFVGSATGSESGFIGINRASATEYNWQENNAGAVIANNSTGRSPGNYFVFRSNNTATNATNDRIGFYSIGSSLNLSLLGSRVSALITAFGVAIP